MLHSLQGGENAPKGRFPYICSLKNDVKQHLCGAVLVNERFALTGGHCVHPSYQLSGKLNAHITVGLYTSTDDEDVEGVEVWSLIKTLVETVQMVHIVEISLSSYSRSAASSSTLILEVGSDLWQ